MKYILIVLSVILIIYWIVPTYLHLKEQGKKSTAIVIKAYGTMLAVSFGIAGVLCHTQPQGYLILLGLIFGLLGDILLELFVPLGGLAFFLGNVIYAYSMISTESLKSINCFLFLIFLLFLVVTFGKDFKSFGPYRFFLIPYAIIVALMAAVAIPYILLQSSHSLLLGLGAFLFAVSDYLLAYRTLYPTSQDFHRVSLGTYYLAQLCIGISIFL